MERADPLFLLIGLPTIPVMLILGKMVHWEDYILRLWRKHSAKLPFLNYLFSDGESVVTNQNSGNAFITCFVLEVELYHIFKLLI